MVAQLGQTKVSLNNLLLKGFIIEKSPHREVGGAHPHVQICIPLRISPRVL